MLPLQAPLAVHEVALLEVQLRVVLSPVVIEAGLALTLTVGLCGLATVTVTERLVLPEVPAHCSV